MGRLGVYYDCKYVRSLSVLRKPYLYLLTLVLCVTIAVGIQSRPSAAPQTGIWVSDYKLVGSPSFVEAVSALSSQVFAYAGTPGFFSIAAEMRNPQHYTRSLMLCQSIVTATYITIGCVVYYYCGSYVSSPALGSAGPTMKKVSYGFALPGLIVTTTLVIHVSLAHVYRAFYTHSYSIKTKITMQIAAKIIFVRVLRGSKHLSNNSFTHWATWIGCTFSVTVIAYVIASGIPVFSNLVSLVGALLGTLLSFQPMGCMWLFDNWTKDKQQRTPRWYFMVGWSCFVIISGTFLMVAGTYGSVVSIIDSYREDGGTAAWTCADNSNS